MAGQHAAQQLKVQVAYELSSLVKVVRWLEDKPTWFSVNYALFLSHSFLHKMLKQT